MCVVIIFPAEDSINYDIALEISRDSIILGQRLQIRARFALQLGAMLATSELLLDLAVPGSVSGSHASSVRINFFF